MDIKPSNFGFIRRGSEVLTQTLTMFDVDSICSVFDPPEELMGTEGFMEPEAAFEQPNNLTDIYAIGATLFYAVAGSDETKSSGYYYREDYYPQLRDMINTSDLVCASEANSHPRLRDALTRILEKLPEFPLDLKKIWRWLCITLFPRRLRKKSAMGNSGFCRMLSGLWTGKK